MADAKCVCSVEGENEAYKISHVAMALKFGAGEATGLRAGSRVGDATRPAEDSAIQREDAAALQELGV